MERMASTCSRSEEPEFSHGRELWVFTSEALAGTVSLSPCEVYLCSELFLNLIARTHELAIFNSWHAREVA